MKLRSAGATDVGRTRDHNEDSFVIIEGEQFFVVADGMGGHESGEVASKIAVDTMGEFFVNTTAGEAALALPNDALLVQAANRLLYGIRLANRNIHEVARRERKTMGTTVVAAHLAARAMQIAHVGDSRAYLIRGGHIAQLTRDHSALEEYKQVNPNVSEEEIRNFPYRNVIMRALGTLPEIKIDLRSVLVEAGDVFLLCCDGLTNMVTDEVIRDVVLRTADLAAATRALIDAANDGGGDDNITVILIRCDDR
jgi:serine/threonine protein phosphatase PrpC